MPASPIPEQFKIDFHPVAEPQAVVTAGGARFSLLTERLVRMEFSPSEQFEDRPSQVFWYRRQPAPAFEGWRDGSRLELRTAALRLVYLDGPAGFSRQTLSVEVAATGSTWRFGQWDTGNLGGTARTLDGADGAIHLEPGLVSRQGWAVVDDSHSLVFTADGWLEQRAHHENLDLYFFGYGHDYAGALREFTLVSGPAPLLPRWALGNWWSRYWPYRQA